MSISAPAITETNADQVVNFTVTLDRAVQGGFDVAISATNGSADGSDYALNTPPCTSRARSASRTTCR